MEVLSQNSHPSQNLDHPRTYAAEGDDFESSHIEFGEFRSHEEVIPFESQIANQIDTLSPSNVVSNTIKASEPALERSVRTKSPQNLRRSPQIPKKQSNTATELINLPISANLGPLVSTLFKPTEELLALLEECRLLLEEVESLDNSMLLAATEQVGECQKLVRVCIITR